MKIVYSLISTFCLLLLALTPHSIRAHAFDPSLLIIEEQPSHQWELYWQRPDLNGSPLPLELILPSSCKGLENLHVTRQGANWVQQGLIECSQDALNQDIVIQQLNQFDVSVIVRFAEKQQSHYSTYLLNPDKTALRLVTDSSVWGVLTTYGYLGFEHILEGWDHLLFLFALMLLIKDLRKLVIAVTAFTVAHSVTLFASTMQLIFISAQFVESIIALSIVFLAYEVVKSQPDKPSLTQQFPWLVTFSFGLLHGFGFAGALQEIGIPPEEVPLTLLAFNLGVEAGQITFLLVVYGMIRLLQQVNMRALNQQRWLIPSCAYLIGTLSSYWLIERVVT